MAGLPCHLNMKALMKVAAGVGNLAIRDIPEPEPQSDQVLIRVKAAGICGTDLHIYHDEFKVRPPVVMGHEIAGIIEAVGSDLGPGLEAGMRVTTETYFSTCGRCRYCRTGHQNLCLNRLSIGSGVNGGFTQYLVVPARNVHELPPDLTFEAGALTEPLACVVHGVLNSNSIAPGDVAVIAGPGAIGLLTLQVLKAAGATVIVLGTDADAERLELAQILGADEVCVVPAGDTEQRVQSLTQEGLGADVVYECAGAGAAARQLLPLVRRGGRYVQIGLFGKSIEWDLDQVCYKELLVTGSNASVPSAWDKALKLLADGSVQTDPLITASYPITEWEAAFEQFNARQGIKTLLTPV